MPYQYLFQNQKQLVILYTNIIKKLYGHVRTNTCKLIVEIVNEVFVSIYGQDQYY